MSSASDSGKAYHLACTGDALGTVNEHSSDADITLFGSCFCPFVQRVWIAFEALGIPYKYYEVDPYKKPKDLLEVSPKGLVPGLRFNTLNPPRALNESTVILEYLEDLSVSSSGKSLLPSKGNPYARALVRLQADHTNRSVVPSFYRYLQAQEKEKQLEAEKEFSTALDNLVTAFERAEREILGGGGASGSGEAEAMRRGLGLWVDGNEEIGIVDAMAGPWLFRASNVLKHYRGFSFSQGEKFDKYLNKLFSHPQFKSTCSTEQLYIESYERYAFNRPNTSQVANAINSGRALP